jgi:hypothetical protein
MPRTGPIDAPTPLPLVDVVSLDRFATFGSVKVGDETILIRRIWPWVHVRSLPDGEIITPLGLK